MIEAGTSKSSVGLVGQQHAALIKRTYPDDGKAFAQHVGDLAGNAEAFLNRIDGIEKSNFYTRPGLVKPITDEAGAYQAGLRDFRRRHIDPLDAQERGLMAQASAPPPTAPEEQGTEVPAARGDPRPRREDRRSRGTATPAHEGGRPWRP